MPGWRRVTGCGGIGPVTEPGELQGALRAAVRAIKETGRAVLVEVVTQNR